MRVKSLTKNAKARAQATTSGLAERRARMRVRDRPHLGAQLQAKACAQGLDFQAAPDGFSPRYFARNLHPPRLWALPPKSPPYRHPPSCQVGIVNTESSIWKLRDHAGPYKNVAGCSRQAAQFFPLTYIYKSSLQVAWKTGQYTWASGYAEKNLKFEWFLSQVSYEIRNRGQQGRG